MTALTVMTCDRPETLGICLGSIASAVRGSLTAPRLLVIDDSRQKETSEANREIVTDTASRLGVPIEYAGATAKQELIDTLTPRSDRSAPPREIVTFALSGLPELEYLGTPGRNRNAGLFLTGGERYVSFDDDTQYCFSRLLPEFSTGSGSCSGAGFVDGDRAGPRYLTGTAFMESSARGMFGSYRELDRVMCRFPHDAVDEILSHLGREFIIDSNEPDDTSTSGHVRIVMVGIRGNRWFTVPGRFYQIQGDLRRLAYEPASVYRSSRTSQYAVQQATGTILTDLPLLVASCYGLDTGSIVPAFTPVGRGEDSIFGLLMKFCYPDNLTAHLPFCIHHDLGPGRPFRKLEHEDVTCSFGMLSPLIIAAVTRQLLSRKGNGIRRSTGPEDRLVLLGHHLRELSSISHSEWLEFIHSVVIGAARWESAYLEYLLEQYDEQPAWWAADARRQIDRLEEQSAVPENAIPRELRQLGSPEAGTAIHRRFYRNYGELLAWWPEIWRRSRCVANRPQFSPGTDTGSLR